ncbi:MAG: hypothetical protein AAF594_07110 [Bacteroidota bacterium]
MASPTSDLPIQAAARLLALGLPSEAADRLGAITRETPTYAAAHVLHATALESAGDPEAALDAWGRAAALVPLSPLVHRERTRLMAALWVPDADDEELPPAVPAPDDLEEDLDADLDALIESLSGLGEDTADPASEPRDGTPAEAPTAEAPTAEAEPIDAETASGPDDPEPFRDVTDALSTVELLPPEDGDPDPVPVVPEAVGPEEGDDDGWDVIAEVPVPSPPPDPRVEPDVIAPEPKPTDPEPTFVVADELDALISQLEDAPRIKPDPAFDGPSVSFDGGDMSEMYSETLAEIYAAQHQYVEAAVVYEKLAQRNPEAAEEMLRKAAALRDRD